MPSKGKKRCGYLLPGGRGRCNKLVSDAKHQYCDYHEKIDKQRFRERAVQSHGKLYSTAKWKRLRAAHLAREPLCAVCGRTGQVVDHIQPHRGLDELFYDSDNLQTLCKHHHDIATQMEIMLRGRGLNGKQIAQYKKIWIAEYGTPRSSTPAGT